MSQDDRLDEPASAERRRHWRALRAAVASVPRPSLAESLQAVADEIPIAVSVDFVNLRLCDPGDRLHLVAASGCNVSEIRKRAFEPLALDRVLEMLESGGHDAVARSVGIQWLDVFWLRSAGEQLGSFALGARTKRRPTRDDLRAFEDICGELSDGLLPVERSTEALRACSLALAREFEPAAWRVEGRPVDRLRPRERGILELYADGLSTGEIADMLVISRHTVRTHVKLALRRLGVHTREEAATLVRADQLAELL